MYLLSLKIKEEDDFHHLEMDTDGDSTRGVLRS